MLLLKDRQEAWEADHTSTMHMFLAANCMSLKSLSELFEKPENWRRGTAGRAELEAVASLLLQGLATKKTVKIVQLALPADLF